MGVEQAAEAFSAGSGDAGGKPFLHIAPMPSLDIGFTS
jgi:hypothetical protein